MQDDEFGHENKVPPKKEIFETKSDLINDLNRRLSEAIDAT